MKTATGNLIIVALALAGLFTIFLQAVSIDVAITVLNGIFGGVLVALIVAYWRLAYNAAIGVRPYTAVRQMTLGFILCWIAYVMSVMVSFYMKSAGVDAAAHTLTAIHRGIAIVAAVLQVTAPDFGLGIFHGRDRRILWTGITLGTIFSIIVIYMQVNESLS